MATTRPEQLVTSAHRTTSRSKKPSSRVIVVRLGTAAARRSITSESRLRGGDGATAGQSSSSESRNDVETLRNGWTSCSSSGLVWIETRP